MRNKNNSIQCLRAIAVFLVIWAHIKFVADFAGNQWIEVATGAIGVDLFFIISGYIIADNIVYLNYNSKLFILHRIIRIAPFYWLMTLPLLIKEIANQQLNLSSLVQSLIFIPLFDFHHFTNPIHNFGWTLSFEMWFYLLLSIITFIFKRKSIKYSAILLVAGSAIVYPLYNGSYFLPLFLFHPLTLEFAIGIIIFLTSKNFSLIHAVLSGCSLLILLPIASNYQYLGYHNDILSNSSLAYQRVFFWGMTGAVTMIFFLSLENIKIIKWPVWLISLGNKAFSIYLIQPYSMIMTKYISNIFQLSALTSGFLFIASTIILGVMLSIIVEFPLNNYLRGKLS